MNYFNIPARLKNPWFWVGLAGVALTAAGVEADTLTSWAALTTALLSLFKNPYLLASTALAVLGVILDPTTSGLSDPLPEEEKEDGPDGL